MTCKDCVHYDACRDMYDGSREDFDEITGFAPDCIDMGIFKNKADFVEVVRCKDCKHSIEFDKHCEINRSAYRHCNLWRGNEEEYVWHKYKKYYRRYSIVELDDYCSYGERKIDNER